MGAEDIRTGASTGEGECAVAGGARAKLLAVNNYLLVATLSFKATVTIYESLKTSKCEKCGKVISLWNMTCG
jgi:hypothetical protein